MGLMPISRPPTPPPPPPMGGPPPPPPMGGPPPPPQGPGADPNMMGSLAAMLPGVDPLQMILSDERLIEQLLGPFPLPRYREKWQEPKKPTREDMLTIAHEHKAQLTAINRRFDDDIARINGESSGVFDDFDEDAEHPWRDRSITNDDNLIVSMIGSIDPIFESPIRRPSDADESQAKEDFLMYLHEEHRRQHEIAGYTDLDMDITRTITRYGRVVTRSICDFSRRPGAAPFRMKLIDPSFVYPEYSGHRGLTRVTMVFQQKISDLIGDHDDSEDTIRKSLLSKKKKGGKLNYTVDDEVEVIEYWDCKWYAVFASDELIKGPIEHDYGEPPFVYTISPFGDPSYTKTPNLFRTVDQNGFQISAVQADFAKRGLSAYHSRFDPHAQREALLSRAFTEASKWGNEPKTIAQDDTVYGSDIEYSNAAGAVNKVRREHEEFVANPTPPLPPTMGVLLQAAGEDAARSSVPPSEYGLTPAQTSGYAMAGLSEHGKNKLAPIIRTKEIHHARVGEQRLRMYRDFGHLLGKEGQRGRIMVPKMFPNPEDTEMEWELTPPMIDRSGTSVKCTLISKPTISELTAQANAFGMYRQRGTLSRRDEIMLSGLPGARNPERAMREIDLEKMREQPEYMLAKLLKSVVTDDNDPALASLILKLWMQGKMKEQASAIGTENAMRPPGPPQGQMGGQPGGPGPAQTPGMSLPMLGQPPGVQGGRPPGGPSIPNFGPGLEP